VPIKSPKINAGCGVTYKKFHVMPVCTMSYQPEKINAEAKEKWSEIHQEGASMVPYPVHQ
jgi:hypothetical protein